MDRSRSARAGHDLERDHLPVPVDLEVDRNAGWNPSHVAYEVAGSPQLVTVDGSKHISHSEPRRSGRAVGHDLDDLGARTTREPLRGEVPDHDAKPASALAGRLRFRLVLLFRPHPGGGLGGRRTRRALGVGRNRPHPHVGRGSGGRLAAPADERKTEADEER